MLTLKERQDLVDLIFDFHLNLDAESFLSKLEEEIKDRTIPSWYRGRYRRSNYCYDIAIQRLTPMIMKAIDQYDEAIM